MIATWKEIYDVDNSSELTSDDLRGILNHYYETDIGNCKMTPEMWIDELVKAFRIDGYLDDLLDQYNRYLISVEFEQ